MSKSDLEDSLLFQMAAVELPKPEPEYHFAESIGRHWRFDLCWPSEMLAVEIQGGTWAGGRHVRGAGYEEDCEKSNTAVMMGWRLLRVTGAMVRDGRALQYVERGLDAT